MVRTDNVFHRFPLPRRAWAVFGAVGVIALVVSSCGGGEGPTVTPPASTPTATRPVAAPTPAPTPTPPPTPAPKYGGVLTLRALNQWPVRDTYDERGGFAQVITSSMTNTLVTTNPYNFKTSEEIIGDLAKEWQLSADGKTYGFRLQPGVRWHDGTPFTSKDVSYSYNRAINPPAPQVTFLKSRFALVDTIETPDDNTVTIRVKQPSVSFLRGIALNFAQIMPAHVPDMQQWNKQVIGTGPFKLKEEKQDVFIEMERSSNYFKKDIAGRQLPYLDGVKYFIIPDPANALAAFRTGNIMANPGTYDSDFVPANRDLIRREIPDIQSQEYTGSRFDLLVNSRGALGDRRLRQAISLYLNRQEIGQVTYGGLGEPLASPLIPESRGGLWGLPREEMANTPGFNPATKDADRTRALALLKEAGFGTGLKLVLTASSSRVIAEGAEAIVTQLKGLGISPELRAVPTALQADLRIRGDFDLDYNSATLDFDDPAAYVTPFVRTGAGRNYGKWSVPKIDDLLDEADRTFDFGKRRQVMQDLQREIMDQLPLIPVMYSGAPNFWRKEVKHWPRVYTALSPAYKFEEVWLDR